MMCHVHGCKALSDIGSITAEQSVLSNTESGVTAHLEESCKKRINKGYTLKIGLISTSCGAFVIVLILYGIVRRRNRPTNNSSDGNPVQNASPTVCNQQSSSLDGNPPNIHTGEIDCPGMDMTTTSKYTSEK